MHFHANSKHSLDSAAYQLFKPQKQFQLRMHLNRNRRLCIKEVIKIVNEIIIKLIIGRICKLPTITGNSWYQFDQLYDIFFSYSSWINVKFRMDLSKLVKPICRSMKYMCCDDHPAATIQKKNIGILCIRFVFGARQNPSTDTPITQHYITPSSISWFFCLFLPNANTTETQWQFVRIFYKNGKKQPCPPHFIEYWNLLFFV